MGNGLDLLVRLKIRTVKFTFPVSDIDLPVLCPEKARYTSAGMYVGKSILVNNRDSYY